MENKVFRKLIEQNAKELKFEKLKTSFLKESDDSVVFLIPRKSGYSNLYYLRIKVKLKPIEQNFDKNEYIKHDVADILLSIDADNKELFDLENDLSDLERTEKLKEFFKIKVDYWINILSCKENIIELNRNKNLFLLPFTKSKLGIE